MSIKYYNDNLDKFDLIIKHFNIYEQNSYTNIPNEPNFCFNDNLEKYKNHIFKFEFYEDINIEGEFKTNKFIEVISLENNIFIFKLLDTYKSFMFDYIYNLESNLFEIKANNNGEEYLVIDSNDDLVKLIKEYRL